MSTDSSEHYLTPEEVAEGLKVTVADVLEWVDQGKFGDVRRDGSKPMISLSSYQRFGSSMPPELLKKISSYMWQTMKATRPAVQRETCERVRATMTVVLERAGSAVKLLETIHAAHEPQIDVIKGRSGSVAGFILYARIISLLYGILRLLRASVPAEAGILFRPLWEAILLADYFVMSEASKENGEMIKQWFAGQAPPKHSKVIRYVHRKMNTPTGTAEKLHGLYSEPIHHTYQTVMGSYRGYGMTGFDGEHTERLGFDYHTSSIMTDLIPIVSTFEQLLWAALLHFDICFDTTWSILSEGERQALKEERDFYAMDELKRIEIILGKPQ
jgi:hypothetical protein